jgi:hypothetical protein
MKIINKGYLDDKYTRICECNNCGCKFEANEKKFYVRIHFEYSYTIIKVVVVCPVPCGEHIEYNFGEVPKIVYKRILKRETRIRCRDDSTTYSISDIQFIDGNYKLNSGRCGVYLDSKLMGDALIDLIHASQKIEKKD